MNLTERITGAWNALTGKAISHHPEIADREHIFSYYASSPMPADILLEEYADYARVYSVYAWVRKAVSKIVENMASLPVRVVDGNGKALDSHPLSLLLERVNDQQSPAELWSAYWIHMLLGGEGPVEIVPDAQGRPAELWARRPDEIIVRPDRTRLSYPTVAEYAYPGYDANGEPVTVTVPAAYMLHDKFYNPLNVWRGLPVIAAVREGIIIDLFSQAWSKNFLKNNARPDFAIIAPQGITQTERNRYLEEFTGKHKGVANAHLPIVLEEGVTDIKTLSFAPKDMEWLEQRRMSRDEVGAIFGVPDEIMGYGKDTYENFQTALETFWTLTLLPLLNRRDVVLTTHFRKRLPLLRPGERIETDTSEVGVLQEDVAPKIEMATKLWDRGVPFNILDEKLNLGIGKIEGGDVAYVPSGMVPLELLAVQIESAKNPPPLPPAQEMSPEDRPENMPEDMPDEEMEREREMRRFRLWARKRKRPDPDKFSSEILSHAEKLAILEGAARVDAPFPAAFDNYP